MAFGLHVAALYVPVMLGFGLYGGFLALTVLSAFKLAWTAGLVAAMGKPVFRTDLIRQYLHFSAPLMLNVLVGNFIVVFDSWLVGWFYRDESVFAIFRYGSREFPLATALATALGVALIPRLTEDMPAGLAELKSKSGRLMHLLFPLTIVMLFVSTPLFPLVFNADFAASAPLFNIYLLITASRVLLPNAIVLAKGAPRAIFWVGMVELAVKITLGFLYPLVGTCGCGLVGSARFLARKTGADMGIGKKIRSGYLFVAGYPLVCGLSGGIAGSVLFIERAAKFIAARRLKTELAVLRNHGKIRALLI